MNCNLARQLERAASEALREVDQIAQGKVSENRAIVFLIQTLVIYAGVARPPSHSRRQRWGNWSQPFDQQLQLQLYRRLTPRVGKSNAWKQVSAMLDEMELLRPASSPETRERCKALCASIIESCRLHDQPLRAA